MIEFDQWLFLLLNGIHHPLMDGIMQVISDKWIWIPLYLILLFVIVREFGIKSVYILLSVAVVAALSDQLSVHLFKNVFQRLRPCHEPEIMSLVHIVDEHCGGQYGFVSSHASNVFGLAVFVGNLLKKTHRYWLSSLLIWAAIVSYSRIYLGVHYPLDIICGALLGSFLAFIIRLALDYFDKRFSLNIFVR